MDGNPLVNGDVIDLFNLPLGTHSFSITATDNAGNTATQTITFYTKTNPADLEVVIDDLVEEGLITVPGVGDSLQAQLESAREAIADRRYQAARNILNAFIDHVESLDGTIIDPVAAQLLIDAANAILATIPTSPSPGPPGGGAPAMAR